MDAKRRAAWQRFLDLSEEIGELEPREKPVLNDPRIASSTGGGMCPEQHNGVLTDGRKFYFWMRHGRAQLHVAALGDEPLTRHPDFDTKAFNEAFDAGKPYTVPFYKDTKLHDAPYPDDGLLGFFESQDDRDACFKRCLDQIWPES